MEIGEERRHVSEPTQTAPERVRRNNKPYISDADLMRFFEEMRLTIETSRSSAEEEEQSSATEEISYHTTELHVDEQAEPEGGSPPLPPPRSSSLLLTSNQDSIPCNYDEAIRGEDSARWIEAIGEELKAHEDTVCLKNKGRSTADKALWAVARPMARHHSSCRPIVT